MFMKIVWQFFIKKMEVLTPCRGLLLTTPLEEVGRWASMMSINTPSLCGFSFEKYVVELYQNDISFLFPYYYNLKCCYDYVGNTVFFSGEYSRWYLQVDFHEELAWL